MIPDVLLPLLRLPYGLPSAEQVARWIDRRLVEEIVREALSGDAGE